MNKERKDVLAELRRIVSGMRVEPVTVVFGRRDALESLSRARLVPERQAPRPEDPVTVHAELEPG